MTGKPLVSIIIPCYNAEEYIEACINSVILQDYENWECIIINDGSKDNTLNIIKIFEAENHKITVFLQENLGLSATRNKGMDNAKGEFIFFLDQDDILVTDAISTMVYSYEDNDIIVGITVTTNIIEGKINKVSQLLHPKEGSITFKNDYFEVLKITMESGLKPVAQNRLYNREFIEKNNLCFKNGILHEDELWFFETMLVAKNVKFINKETYYYRIDNAASITKNLSDNNLKSYILVMEEILKKYGRDEKYGVIATWYAVYIKKIFFDFAIRERTKLSKEVISEMEKSLKTNYVPLGKKNILSKNNSIYYRTINKLSLNNFRIIEKYFFRNKINSLRKLLLVLKINFLK